MRHPLSDYYDPCDCDGIGCPDSGDCTDVFSSAYPCELEEDDPFGGDECDSSSSNYLGDCACFSVNCDTNDDSDDDDCPRIIIATGKSVYAKGSVCAEEEEDPCEQLKELLNQDKLDEKTNELKGKLKEEREFGFKTDFDSPIDNLYKELDVYKDSNGNEVSRMLDVRYDQDTKGYIHTHFNPIVTSTDDGGFVTNSLIPMFSPEDIGLFLDMLDEVSDNSQNDISEMYAGLVTKGGNYILKFTGSESDLNHNKGTTQLANRKKAKDGDFEDYYKKLVDNDKDEAALLRFMRFGMQIKGLSLYEIDKKGKALKHKLKEDNLTKLDKPEECP